MFANKQTGSMQRVITATLGWIVAFGVISYASVEVFNVVICMAAILSFNEFLRMYRINRVPVLYGTSLFAYLLICTIVLITPGKGIQFGLTVASLIVMTVGVVILRDPSHGMGEIARVVFGFVYVSLLLYLVDLRLMNSGRELILILSAGTWGRDLAAYIFGRVVTGGQAILPILSPRKTYRGAIFGLVSTVIIVFFSASSLISSWSFIDKLAVGLLIGILGQVGDLAESWLKRGAEVVDSSQILPGQGGMLDSIDSFMFTTPAFYLYLVLAIGK